MLAEVRQFVPCIVALWMIATGCGEQTGANGAMCEPDSASEQWGVSVGTPDRLPLSTLGVSTVDTWMVDAIKRDGNQTVSFTTDATTKPVSLYLPGDVQLPFSVGQDVRLDFHDWPAFNSEYAGNVRDTADGHLLLSFASASISRVGDSHISIPEVQVSDVASCEADWPDSCGKLAHHTIKYAGRGDTTPLRLLGPGEGDIEIDGHPYHVMQGASDSGTSCSVDGIVVMTFVIVTAG